MNTKILLTALVSSFIIHTSSRAQGSLTPPAGAPAPVMKSLDQIEARMTITNTSSLVTISQPGSYYLSGNLTISSGNAINITTNCVTLDLNGFTIRSTAASAAGTAISIGNGLSDITIRNGHIRGSVTNNGSGTYNGGGFQYGIFAGGTVVNAQVSHISVSRCWTYGIVLNSESTTLISDCTVETVGNTGIWASTVKNCLVQDCGFLAIKGDQVSDCRAEAVGSSGGSGLQAKVALNCIGTSMSGNGITSTTAQNCFGSSTSGIGLSASIANNSTGDRFGGTAIQAFIANSCSAVNGTNNITYKYNMP